MKPIIVGQQTLLALFNNDDQNVHAISIRADTYEEIFRIENGQVKRVADPSQPPCLITFHINDDPAPIAFSVYPQNLKSHDTRAATCDRN